MTWSRHDHEVANVDMAPQRTNVAPFTRVDLTEFGQVVEAFTRIDSRYERVDATVMSRLNEALVRAVFPDVSIRRPLGEHDTLLSIDKARRVLGYEPTHGWRSIEQV